MISGSSVKSIIRSRDFAILLSIVLCVKANTLVPMQPLPLPAQPIPYISPIPYLGLTIDPKSFKVEPLELHIAPSTLRLSTSMTILASWFLIASYCLYKDKYKTMAGTTACASAALTLLHYEII
jgi:hypothetical protein